MTKLNNIQVYEGTITLKSGLKIGGSDNEMRIGGVDSPVIKNPLTHEPYIPGSSLKGKIRSLLELVSGHMGETNGAPLTMATANDEWSKIIVKLFGQSADSKSSDKVIARLSFWDCYLENESKEKIKQLNNNRYTEVKTENSINRITGTAENPRQMERVPASAVFDFKLTMKIIEGDKKEDLEKVLKQGIKLLESDSLGSSGSRGYGKVEFNIPELFRDGEKVYPFDTTI